MEIKSIDIKDLEPVVEIHMRAFRKSAITALGVEAVRRYYQWLLTGPHQAFYFGAWMGDYLAGYCFCGKFNKALTGFLERNRAFLMVQVIKHPWLVRNEIVRDRLKLALHLLTSRRKTMQNPLDSSDKKDHALDRSFGVLAIATDPDVQNQGIGHALMVAVEQTAAQLGYQRMNLSVATDNAQAVRFYERSGWMKELSANGVWGGTMKKEMTKKQ